MCLIGGAKRAVIKRKAHPDRMAGDVLCVAGAQGDDSRRKVWLSLGVNDDPLTLHEKIPSQRLGQIVDKVSDLQTLKSLQDKEARLQMKAHT